MNAGFDHRCIHLPLPQPGTPCKFARLTQKHRPVLHAEAVLTFPFDLQPPAGLFRRHSPAKIASHFRIAPQCFGKRSIVFSPAGMSNEQKIQESCRKVPVR